MATETINGQTSPSTSIPKATAARCKLCGGERIHRMHRHGWRERVLFPLFGYFPWRCSTCRSKMLLKRRERDDNQRKHYVA